MKSKMYQRREVWLTKEGNLKIYKEIVPVHHEPGFISYLKSRWSRQRDFQNTWGYQYLGEL